MNPVRPFDDSTVHMIRIGTAATRVIPRHSKFRFDIAEDGVVCKDAEIDLCKTSVFDVEPVEVRR